MEITAALTRRLFPIINLLNLWGEQHPLPKGASPLPTPAFRQEGAEKRAAKKAEMPKNTHQENRTAPQRPEANMSSMCGNSKTPVTGAVSAGRAWGGGWRDRGSTVGYFICLIVIKYLNTSSFS